MNNHKKRKIQTAIASRSKSFDKERVKTAWRNIFVQAGILK
ncbi:DUF3983 domain-containing protein [Bacillus cereus]|nr:DUF3983 domain-containing protein [Bacillus cereus]PEL94963.1 DUF3983 domain-containing protein [Bacillus cereus]